jgi:hypothetical protein
MREGTTDERSHRFIHLFPVLLFPVLLFPVLLEGRLHSLDGDEVARRTELVPISLLLEALAVEVE